MMCDQFSLNQLELCTWTMRSQVVLTSKQPVNLSFVPKAKCPAQKSPDRWLCLPGSIAHLLSTMWSNQGQLLLLLRPRLCVGHDARLHLKVQREKQQKNKVKLSLGPVAKETVHFHVEHRYCVICSNWLLLADVVLLPAKLNPECFIDPNIQT